MSQPLAEGALGVSEAFTARACSGRGLQWWPFLPMSWFVLFKKGFPVYGQETFSPLSVCVWHHVLVTEESGNLASHQKLGQNTTMETYDGMLVSLAKCSSWVTPHSLHFFLPLFVQFSIKGFK